MGWRSAIRAVGGTCADDRAVRRDLRALSAQSWKKFAQMITLVARASFLTLFLTSLKRQSSESDETIGLTSIAEFAESLKKLLRSFVGNRRLSDGNHPLFAKFLSSGSQLLVCADFLRQKLDVDELSVLLINAESCRSSESLL